MSFGLPSWTELIRRLFELAGDQPPHAFDLRTQADYFKEQHCDINEHLFAHAIAEALYLTFDPDIHSLGRHDLLRTIGSLLMSSHRHGLRHVISFAFDDILETYLRQHGLTVTSITEDWHWSRHADITVFHPFGLLPHRHDIPRSSHLVLDSESYALQFGEQQDLKTQFLLTQLRTHFCIFIGLTLSDTYVDSILVQVMATHAGRVEGLPYWGITFTTSTDLAYQSMLQHRGVFVKTIADYGHSLPKFLSTLNSTDPIQDLRDRNVRAIAATELHSVFISYGGPDERFALRLNGTLANEGVRTFLFSQHAKPGQKLHRLMREGVNIHDRVILICSRASLDRRGVVNEIEETLQRESREGGTSILIPITLDNYVFEEWSPERPDIAQSIRDRVVADFRGVEDNYDKYNAAIQRIVSALNRTIENDVDA